MNPEGIDKQQLKQAYTTIKGIKIPSIPKTLMSLQQELNREQPDQTKIISLIGEDISLSGRIIQNINSAKFSLAAEVTSIEHATIILGVRNLSEMIVATALRKALEDSLPGFVTITEYSNKVGIAARMIASKSGLSDPESAFLMGLFHKAGTMLLMQKFDNYAQIHDQYKYDPNTLLKKELALFGCNYATVSFILAHHWKLPALTAQAIACHLTMSSSIDNDTLRLFIATLQIASYLTQSTERNFEESDSSIAIKKQAMKELNFDNNSLQDLSDKISEM